MSEETKEFPDRDEEIERSQRKRARNRVNSLEMLRDRGFNVEEKNLHADGTATHLIVRRDDLVCDFWPGTGKWIFRLPDKPTGRGVREMMQKFQVIEQSLPSDGPCFDGGCDAH